MQPHLKPSRQNMEDDLNFCNGRQPHLFLNGRQPQFFLMEEDLNFIKMEVRPDTH